jgi:hypothetical protein
LRQRILAIWFRLFYLTPFFRATVYARPRIGRYTAMPYNETLAARIRKLLGSRKNLAEKQLFGGIAFLLDGNICCGAWKEFLILRLGPDTARHVLCEEHARPFDITRRPMRGWAMVEPAGWQNDASLRRWVSWAEEFTLTLPPK